MGLVNQWGATRVVGIGMYLRDKPKKLGYIYSEVGGKTPNY